MQLRVARHTERLHQVVAFYRDGLGLPEIGGFRDHHGCPPTATGDHGLTFEDPDGFRVVLMPEPWPDVTQARDA